MLTFIVPGSLHQITGGYLFDRHVVAGVRALGREVRVLELAGSFPAADVTACAAADASLAGLADGSVAVIDGLALPGFAHCLGAHADRLRIVGFVHHPLALETGLTPAAAAHYADLEPRLWRRLHAFICPSAATAGALEQAGIAPSRIAIVAPGTAKPASIPQRTAGNRVRLLAVGTVCARKGHDVLMHALAPLRSLPWQLDCVGSLTRAPEFVAAVRSLIADASLTDRIVLRGEVAPQRLGAAYAAADVFVLPSWYEGYGMAYAEALTHGLPVIATTAGAIPETLPDAAALFVEPGQVNALCDALRRLIADAALRQRLSAAAARAGAALPTWSEASAHWLAALDRLTA